ncbi:MAG: HAD family hydrolase [Candidatus Neomarinimicrobiota bacterium]
MIIRAVIFDLDGTLIDTTHEIQYIFNQLLEFYSLPKRSFDFFKANIGNGVEDLLQKSLPDDYSEDISPMLEKVKEIYAENLNKKSRPFNGITEILNLLNENGIQIGIITNKMHHLAIRCVDTFFPSHPIITFGAGYLYPRKPSPDSALVLADEFKTKPSEMLFIGDSSVDIKTAKNAGMVPIGVEWGNGTVEELLGAGAQEVFNKPHDLKGYFLNFCN